MEDRLKVDLCLRFFAKDLEPDEITAILGIEPTDSYRNGAAFYAPSGEKRGTRRQGAWMYSENLDDVKSLEESCDFFLEKLSGIEKQIRSILDNFEVEADIFVGVFEDRSIPYITLSPRLLRKLSNLALTFHCSFYT